MATVAWLSQLYLNYEEPITRFTQILRSKGGFNKTHKRPAEYLFRKVFLFFCIGLVAMWRLGFFLHEMAFAHFVASSARKKFQKEKAVYSLYLLLLVLGAVLDPLLLMFGNDAWKFL